MNKNNIDLTADIEQELIKLRQLTDEHIRIKNAARNMIDFYMEKLRLIELDFVEGKKKIEFNIEQNILNCDCVEETKDFLFLKCVTAEIKYFKNDYDDKLIKNIDIKFI